MSWYYIVKACISILIGIIIQVNVVNAALVRNDLYFKGNLVNQPCKISQGFDSIDVSLGEIHTKKLYENGRSDNVPFGIELSQCQKSGIYNSIKVTFTGVEDENLRGHLKVNGDVSGIAIAIANQDEIFLPLGTASSAVSIENGTVMLKFFAYIDVQEQAKVNKSIQAGDYAATANFLISYQ